MPWGPGAGRQVARIDAGVQGAGTQSHRGAGPFQALRRACRGTAFLRNCAQPDGLSHGQRRRQQAGNQARSWDMARRMPQARFFDGGGPMTGAVLPLTLLLATTCAPFTPEHPFVALRCSDVACGGTGAGPGASCGSTNRPFGRPWDPRGRRRACRDLCLPWARRGGVGA